ncbi:hypothetical protein MVEN_01036600 [Mycena venus]|uniref:F-box domain-containing protein n=1 Tax=Mycena venus TaxID=2733690 RepID=A0A8H6Y9R6_9AGAR|nr:hypothetical protein MVEN_01036600 [Mycena venus]
MTLDEPSQFSALPTEVLLIILGELYETHYFPVRRQPGGFVDYNPSRAISTAFRSIGNLRSISVVNQRLRLLCVPLLFKITRCTSLERLKQLRAECTVNPEFARRIEFVQPLLLYISGLKYDARQLDVVETDTEDVLHELLPCLTSLARLDLNAERFDVRLLAAVNSHPILATVAIHELNSPGLHALEMLVLSTDLPFSKILFSTTPVTHRFAPISVRALAQRGARFSYLFLHGLLEIRDGSGDLPDLPGLEQLDLSLRDSIQSWLPHFVQRHAHVHTISFTDWQYMYTLDIPGNEMPFAPQFLNALRSEGLFRVRLDSFSIARPASWTSLKDWKVVKLELRLDDARLVSSSGFSALEAATMLAPGISSLDIILPNSHFVSMFTPASTHIDEFAKSLSSMPSLRTLHLTNAYASLSAGGETPWILPSSKRALRAAREARGTSSCVTALDALRWYGARIVQQAPVLELVHVTDGGTDGRGRFTTPWRLEASFRVRCNGARDLEIVGTPKLEMAPKYLPQGR